MSAVEAKRELAAKVQDLAWRLMEEEKINESEYKQLMDIGMLAHHSVSQSEVEEQMRVYDGHQAAAMELCGRAVSQCGVLTRIAHETVHMCLCGPENVVRYEEAERMKEKALAPGGTKEEKDAAIDAPVSYTHLTLPTILLV